MNYPNYIFDLYGTLLDIWIDEESPVLWERTALWYREQGTARKGSRHDCHSFRYVT